MKKLVLPLLLMFSITLGMAQPMVRVWGSPDSLTTIAQVRQCLNYLEVYEPVYLHVSFASRMPETLKGITYAQKVPAAGDTLFIRVRIQADLNEMTRRLILAHEMVHVKQYVKGELRVIDRQQAVWQGKEYRYGRFEHRQTPWERDAFRHHRQLAKVAKEPSLAPLTASRSEDQP